MPRIRIMLAVLIAMMTVMASMASSTAASIAPPKSIHKPGVGIRLSHHHLGSAAAPTVGEVLTTSNGTWTNNPIPPFLYSWQDCNAAGVSCVAIAGATSSSYTVATADIGSTIAVIVTACNGGGCVPQKSNVTGLVTGSGAPSNTSLPILTGGPGFPNLAAGVDTSNGSWANAPTGFTYQWQACDGTGAGCANISGATSSGYTLTSPVIVGSTVRVIVTATNGAGSTPAISAASAKITGLPFNFPGAAPTISGSAVQGQTLSVASDGTWANTPTGFTVAWQRCNSSGLSCAPISGATSTTYTLVSGDVGNTVLAEITASNALGAGPVADSAVTAVVTASAVAANHVPTWDRFGSSTATQAQVRAWVTFEESDANPPTAANDCSSGTFCQRIEYNDPNYIYTGCPPLDNSGVSIVTSSSENWWLHIPGSTTTRIAGPGGCSASIQENQNTVGLQSWWNNRNQTNTNVSGFQWIFEDDQSLDQFSATNEIANTGAAWAAEHTAFSNSQSFAGGAGVPQVDNTIPDCGNPNEAQGQGIGTVNLLTGNVKGLLAEGCPYASGQFAGNNVGGFFPGLLDDIAWVDNNTTGFTGILSYGNASGNAAARRAQQATEMLGWDSTNLYDGMMSWEDLEQDTSNLSAFPEQGIVPTGPLQSMAAPSGTCSFTSGAGTYCSTGGHNSLQPGAAPTGVFVREFHDCYNQGTEFGACAAIVNASGSTQTIQSSWLAQTYGHSVTLSSGANAGSIVDGGTININGATFTAGTTTVPTADAIILTHVGAEARPPRPSAERLGQHRSELPTVSRAVGIQDAIAWAAHHRACPITRQEKVCVPASIAKAPPAQPSVPLWLILITAIGLLGGALAIRRNRPNR